jgi:general secretion pathway protein A
MYEEYFGLEEKPFNLTPDPYFLYLSRGHKEALDHLYYGLIRGEGFISVYGDVGVGKTTVCRELLRMLDDGFITSLVLNPHLTEKELVRTILDDFGVDTSTGTKKDLLDRLNAFLLEQGRRGKKPVIIIDESQNLSHILLEQVRMISNLEADKYKLVQIILVGQKELRDKLKSRSLRQLNQRITVRYEIEPLSIDDARNYINHRMGKAGSKSGVFSESACKVIFKLTRGTPRLINVVADRALLSAYVRGGDIVEKVDVRDGVKSLGESDDLFVQKKKIFGRLFG